LSEPRKHHCVPVCYLKQWADTEDRRLCEHKLIPGGYGVKARRTSPDGTGYQIDLYRAPAFLRRLPRTSRSGSCV
jgi:hypothetical protein